MSYRDAAGAILYAAERATWMALEAIQVGGIVEFGERESGIWRVRLAVPLGRP